MDFAWVVGALRRGLKVTRKGWLLTNSTMYMKMVKDAELDCDVARIFCMGRQASTWCPTQDQLFKFTDWEEYVESKKEPVFGNTKLNFDENGQPHMGDTMTVEEYKRMHSGEPVCEAWPALKKVWTTYWDLEIQITGSLLDKSDYPYTLCERDVIEQKSDKLVVLAEPGFSQRTVTLRLNENCWADAKAASARLIHRLTNRFGWNTEFFISLLNGIEHTDGDWCKPCFEGDNRSLGDLFTEDMEFLAQEQARVAHSFYYIINQYLRLVQTTAPERQRRNILARCEESMRQHGTVLAGLSKKDINHV